MQREFDAHRAEIIIDMVACSDILLQEIIFILLLFQFGHPQFQFYFNYSS